MCFLTFDFDYFFSNEYLSKDLEQIPIEERFIYKYLKDKRAKEAEKPASDDESVTSEDFNAAMKSEMDRDMDFAGNLQDAGDENDEDSDEEAGKNFFSDQKLREIDFIIFHYWKSILSWFHFTLFL